jgi:hypothetical protein
VPLAEPRQPLASTELQRQFRFSVALEFAVALLVIAGCMVVLLLELDTIAFKARFSEALTGLRTPQLQSVERVALTGSLAEASFAVPPTVRGYAGRIDLTVRAAMREGDEPAALIWLCGERATPPGWIASGPPAPGNLPRPMLISQCRKDGAQ